MKNIVCIAGIYACVASFAADLQATNADDAAKIDRKERLMRNTGGMITKPGKGKVIIVNCQDKVAASEVAERGNYIQRILRYNCEVVQGEWSLATASSRDAGAVVYFVNDKSLPMSLIAPEAHWGVINTVNLNTTEQLQKEFARVFCLVAGAAKSHIKTSVMQTVSHAGDLDKLKSDGFTMDMVQSITSNLKDLGVTQNQMSSYRKACEEGWAPAPTNEYQKAIWDKTHEIPTEPLKIKFEK